ncbi:hypothetical protein BMR1_03g03941 [Babesia microti strain RI]|uniref:Uncharacterized protein n=1 Tax=Babesia microti (strain RI) TaxID=1133968 RepID=A0A1R4AC84_BABMR|nr:hypothetical protein BMR1_03g03941 [Babesia microti strain RI]SJK86622.1 hypothetical protein BMR1_03g03941 [Babesia microti strain RI]|eukprot:XP_021338759.1 hypothetical protein BMR1_03g03941 [Babesia microti strain RI]
MVESAARDVKLGDSDDDIFIDQIKSNIDANKAHHDKIQEDEISSESNINSLNADDTNSVVSDISPESLSE